MAGQGEWWRRWLTSILAPIFTRRAPPSGERPLVYERGRVVGEVRKP